MTNFVVKNNGKNYHASISFSKYVFDNQEYIIKFGNKNKYVKVYCYENEPNARIWMYLFNIQKRYIIKNYEKMIAIIQSAISFTKKKFPFIQTFSLIDDSVIRFGKNVMIPLPHYHIMKYKTTFFQMKLNGDFEKQITEHLDMINEKLDSKSEKAKYKSYHDFFKCRILLVQYHIHPSIFKYLEPNREVYHAFSNAQTIRAFFLWLDETYTSFIFHGWLEIFLSRRFVNHECLVYPENIILNIESSSNPFSFADSGTKLRYTDPLYYL
jgi:hypothetical protein